MNIQVSDGNLAHLISIIADAAVIGKGQYLDAQERFKIVEKTIREMVDDDNLVEHACNVLCACWNVQDENL